MIERFERVFTQRGNLFLGVLCLGLLAYGYKLFTFSLGIDEEYEASEPNMVMTWLSQGRWGMAVLNGLLLPRPVMPVVSTAIAVAGLAGGIYLFLERLLNRQLALFAGLAVGLTFPTFAFILSFSTISYGIGVGALCVGLFGSMIAPHDHNGKFLLAVLAGSFAIAIYQPFLVCLAVVAIFSVYREAGGGNAPMAWRLVLRYILAAIGALLLYSFFDFAVRAILHVKLAYVQSQFDLDGLVAHPHQRLYESWKRVANVFTLSANLFGHKPYIVTTTLALALLVLVRKALSGDASTCLLKLLCLLALPILLTGIEATMIYDVPLRSMVYVSFLLAALIGLAIEDLGPRLAMGFLLLVATTVLAEVTLTNQLFLSAEITYEQDRDLAKQLIARIEEQPGFDPSVKEMQLEVAGNWHWQPSALAGKRGLFDDAVGASFFEWDMGNRRRMAYFMALNGMPQLFGSNYDRLENLGQLKDIAETIKAMPAWPAEGSVKLFSKEVALVKFGSYSPPQVLELCDAGRRDYCPAGYTPPARP